MIEGMIDCGIEGELEEGTEVGMKGGTCRSEYTGESFHKPTLVDALVIRISGSHNSPVVNTSASRITS